MMCSNCSGDDLSPESFATFDVSSPRDGDRFANGLREKRKRYGTMTILKDFIKRALTLAVMRAQAFRRSLAIIKSVHHPSFVNLNLGKLSDEDMANTRKITEAAGIMEIRVSADSIVEVYSGAGPVQLSRSEHGYTEGKYVSSWDESYAERSDLRRAMRTFRRTRRLKHAAAYGMFVMLAAIAVWCVVR
jgi:hypothetical protein